MAYKNLLNPNVATGTDFKKIVSPFVNGYAPGASFASSTDRAYQGNNSLKVTTPGNAIYEGVEWDCQVSPSTTYATQCRVWAPLGAKLEMRIVRNGNGATNVVQFTGNGAWQFLWGTMTTYSNSNVIQSKILTDTVSQALNFYVDVCQLELGSTATTWEFPGVDLTGNSITANTLVNNIKLENIIRAFGIESTEQVNNLTLQNILTLTNIPSEEYVNNIKLLNEIILEAIESTTSVKDLIIYILNEIAVYQVNIQRKQEYNTILNTKQTYEVKV